MAEVVSAAADLFQYLRPSLRRDLVATGIPNPVAGSILNWFNPAHPEYLARVDAWQQAMCRQVNINRWPFFGCESNPTIDFSTDVDFFQLSCIHQVARLLYKWHGEPAKKTDWAEVEDRLSHPLPIRLTDREISGIRRELSALTPPDLNEAIGRFGPGATCERFDSFQKWSRLGQIPDVPPNLFRVNSLDPTTFAPNHFRFTRMAEVPKSIKSNRTVSSEPAMSMYAQLAVADDLVDQLHARYYGHVSLHDQENHNRLMYESRMATLDLSDASDHNSAELVSLVLPQLWPVLAKVRSEYTQTPKSLFKLGTFAPMGSGVCFPVMTAVLIGITRYAFRSLGFNPVTEKYSWYGDDGIVPLFIADYIIDLLERAGFVVNYSKSCFSGVYLESCGLELWNGREITPVYIKDPLHTLDAAKVELIVAKMQRVLPSTAQAIIDAASPVKGWRWNNDLQRSELLVRCSAARSKLKSLDGYSGLFRWFTVGSLQRLKRSCRPLDHQGVETEVWTKRAWRFKPASNYPNLALWMATRA